MLEQTFNFTFSFRFLHLLLLSQLFEIGHPNFQIPLNFISSILFTYTNPLHITLYHIQLFRSSSSLGSSSFSYYKYISLNNLTTTISSFLQTCPSYLNLLSLILCTVKTNPLIPLIQSDFYHELDCILRSINNCLRNFFIHTFNSIYLFITLRFVSPSHIC